MTALPIPTDYPDVELGEIRNSLHILTPDFNHFSPGLLLENNFNVTELAKMLGIQRTQLYTKQVPLKKGSKLRKRIIHIVIATDLAYLLLKHSKKKALHWLVSPNLTFFGESPFEVIMRDEGEFILAWLMERLGLKPGTAF